MNESPHSMTRPCRWPWLLLPLLAICLASGADGEERSMTEAKPRSYKSRVTAGLKGRNVFSCVRVVRVVTDLDGHVREVVGIAPGLQTVVVQVAGARLELIVKPDQVWRFDSPKPVLHRAAPFDYPHHR